MIAPSRPHNRKLITAAAVAGCIVLVSQGCYEKVVGASGFGAQGVSIEKPNGPDTRSSKTFEYKQSNQRQLPSPGSK